MTDTRDDKPEANGELKRKGYEQELARLHVEFPFGPRLAADALPSEDSPMAAPGQPIRVPAFAVVPH